MHEQSELPLNERIDGSSSVHSPIPPKGESTPLILAGVTLIVIALMPLIEQLFRDIQVRSDDAGYFLGETYAQWMMALAAVAALAVSVWAVVLLKSTLHATRAALTKADDANRIAREIGQAQVRAYLSSPQIDIDFEDQKHIGVTVYYKNSGQSPAINIIASVHINVFGVVSNTDKEERTFRITEFAGMRLPDAIANQISQQKVVYRNINLTRGNESCLPILRTCVLEVVLIAHDVFGEKISSYSCLSGQFSDRMTCEARPHGVYPAEYIALRLVEHRNFVENHPLLQEPSEWLRRAGS